MDFYIFKSYQIEIAIQGEKVNTSDANPLTSRIILLSVLAVL